MELRELLLPMLYGLNTYQIDGTTYYLGCEIIEVLNLSNITQAMGRSKNPPKISRRNWDIKLIPAVNDQRGVYLFTFDGVIEIVRNNNNRTCKDIRELLTNGN